LTGIDTDLSTRGRHRKRLTNQLTSAHTQTSQRTTAAAFPLPNEWPAWTTVPATTETTFPLTPSFPCRTPNLPTRPPAGWKMFHSKRIYTPKLQAT